MNFLRHCLFFIIVPTIIFSCKDEKPKIKLEVELSAPQVLHGIQKIKELAGTGRISLTQGKADITIQANIDSVALPEEAFQIVSENNVVQVTGGDEVGLMYGLLEIKEQLKNGHQTISSKWESPHLSFRALKFNLPWDSYRRGEALQLHHETCRDTVFWHAFLDMMTENRFNKLTLWNLHPFNYLVRTKKYPEACGFSDEELAEWEKFWHTLFRMAKDRGIETYLVNWNIFVSPEFARAHNVAEYSIRHEYNVKQGDTSEIIKDYMRECVKEVIDKYPDLTGLGITLGEGMGGMTAEEREEWLLDSFIDGMRQASRKIKFIHRVPLSAGRGSGGSTSASVEIMTRQTLDTLTCIDGPINIELKFNWSHAHSTPHLAKVHGGKLTDAYWNPLPENYYLAWMMRNEDFFVLRWGQPDFIRQHIAQNVHPHVNGYYVGSECYIPAKDYITSLEGTSYNYAFERQWMFYKTWGRLLYKPDTPDKVFEEAFIARFPEFGRQLFNAQVMVSRVPLIIASFWNATWDFTLYSEGMLSILPNRNQVGLMSLSEMSEKIPMDPTLMSVKEFVEDDNTEPHGKITPIHLADSIYSFCMKALQEVEDVNLGNNIDLLYEVSDITTWANLGLYFSNKLKASVEYQKYMETGDIAFHTQAMQWLEKATVHWRRVVEITEPIYDPMPLMHYNLNNGKYFHWSKVEQEVLDELRWLRNLNLSDVQ